MASAERPARRRAVGGDRDHDLEHDDPGHDALDRYDLDHHGDAELGTGLVDLAVNVRQGAPPRWLIERLTAAVGGLGAYPDQRAALAAVAARHHRDQADVVLTAGAAEAFVLLARILRPRHAVVVQPQFTEPEAALRAGGHAIERVVLPWPYTLEPGLVPEHADLVVIGNPTNPTSVAHPAAVLAALARPGRTLVIDEAFIDCLPGERESLASRTDLPGLVVIRSLTKTWGLAGLRAGYLLAAPETAAAARAAQPLWPVSTPALVACEACCEPAALAEADAWTATLAADRGDLAAKLVRLPGVAVVPDAAASFLLLRVDLPADIRGALRAAGFAVRRGDTFPGLDARFLRVAVRDRATTDRFTTALADILADAPAPNHPILDRDPATSPARGRP